jgi:uncharacterized protein YodC (DUF2158 family)
MIKPTVGHVVLFQPSKPSDQPLRDQPFAATISYVWGDRMVNLAYVDQNGTAGNATSVTLLQDDDVGSDRGYFAYWMPFQVEQADKAAKEAEHGIKAGDTVRLRSGGPLMVVESVSGQSVVCMWAGEYFNRESFKAATLDKVQSGAAADVKLEHPSGSAVKNDGEGEAQPSPSSVVPRIRVVTDGGLTKVYDHATGEEIKLVQALRMEHHKGGRMYARVETLAQVATATVVSDAEVEAVSPDTARSKGPVWEAYEGPVLAASDQPLVFTVKGELSEADLARFRASWDDAAVKIAHNGDVTITAPNVSISGSVKLGEDGPLLAEGTMQTAAQTEGLDIGGAVRALNAGMRLKRRVWGDVWLALSPGTPALQADKFWAGPNRDYAASRESGTAHVLPSVTVKLETGEIVMGWAANPVDLLAQDWCVV